MLKIPIRFYYHHCIFIINNACGIILERYFWRRHYDYVNNNNINTKQLIIIDWQWKKEETHIQAKYKKIKTIAMSARHITMKYII